MACSRLLRSLTRGRGCFYRLGYLQDVVQPREATGSSPQLRKGAGWKTVKVRLVVLVTALAVAPSGAALSAQKSHRLPVPPATLAKIRAVYGRDYALLPKWVPSGLVYLRWKTLHRSPEYLLDTLTLTFARNGSMIEWSISDVSNHAALCHDTGIQIKHLYYAGRLIIWSTGNRFGSASTCVHIRGLLLQCEVMVRYGPGTPPLAQLERMLLSAVPRGRAP